MISSQPIIPNMLNNQELFKHPKGLDLQKTINIFIKWPLLLSNQMTIVDLANSTTWSCWLIPQRTTAFLTKINMAQPDTLQKNRNILAAERR